MGPIQLGEYLIRRGIIAASSASRQLEILRPVRPSIFFASAMIVSSMAASVAFVQDKDNDLKARCKTDISLLAACNAIVNIVACIGTIMYWIIDSPHRVEKGWSDRGAARILLYYVIFVRMSNLYAFSLGNMMFYMYWYAGCDTYSSSLVLGCGALNSFTWCTVALEIVYKSAHHTLYSLGITRQEVAGVIYESTPVDSRLQFESE